MKRCLVVSVKKKKNTGEYSHQLAASEYQRAGANQGIEYVGTTYDDMDFFVSNETFSITAHINGTKTELSDFDMIYLVRVGDNLELASVISLYANYTNTLCLPGDLEYVRPNGKLLQAVHLYLNKVSTIATYFTEKNNNPKDMQFNYPFVYKVDRGSKGRDNFLIKSEEQWQDILDGQNERFIQQRFTPNDGDYRVLCFGYKAKLVIKRSAQSGKYLNNTSQGASAELVELNEMPVRAVELSEAAARAMNNEVVGVDIVQSQLDGAWYIIEVNQSPQISTGAFVDQKLRALTNFFESRI